MLEGRFKPFGTTSEISKDFRRLPMISEDQFKKIQIMRVGRVKDFATISKIFRRFPKILKNFGNFLECWVLQSPVLFAKFSKEFPNIRQRPRRHEPLFPVTNRPLIFSCTVEPLKMDTQIRLTPL